MEKEAAHPTPTNAAGGQAAAPAAQTALLGFGTVGRAVDEIVREKPLGLSIKYVFRRRGKTAGDPRFTDDFEKILNDPEITVVIDAMAGPEPSRTCIEKALDAGKSVVTANKAAVGPVLDRLSALARSRGVSLGLEASCGGAVPWIVNVNRVRSLESIRAFFGILNGTGNFILGEVAAGRTFDQALADAQRAGYAEADPSADIDGHDLAAKAQISAAAAFGVLVPKDRIPCASLRGVSSGFIEDARKRGLALRFMTFGRMTDKGPALAVFPALVPGSRLESRIDKNFNSAVLVSEIAGELAFVGAGAGGRPTADAVVNDALAVVRGELKPLPPIRPLSPEEISAPAPVIRGDACFAAPDGRLDPAVLTDVSVSDALEEAKRRGVFMAFRPRGFFEG